MTSEQCAFVQSDPLRDNCSRALGQSPNRGRSPVFRWDRPARQSLASHRGGIAANQQTGRGADQHAANRTDPARGKRTDQETGGGADQQTGRSADQHAANRTDPARGKRTDQHAANVLIRRPAEALISPRQRPLPIPTSTPARRPRLLNPFNFAGALERRDDS